MTLSGVIALLLRFLAEFDYFAGQLPVAALHQGAPGQMTSSCQAVELPRQEGNKETRRPS